MTTWRYYEAKKHVKMLDGVGLPVSDTPSRDKIDSSSLEHFIDFITSSHIKTCRLDRRHYNWNLENF